MDAILDKFVLNYQFKKQAGELVAQRSKPLAVIFALLYVAALMGLNVAPKESVMVRNFVIYVVALSGLIFLLSTLLSKSSESSLLRKGLYLVIIAMGASWGGACAYIQYTAPLGWTSFILILMSLFLSAGQLTSLIPDFRLLFSFQTVLLAPSLYVNFYSIGGTQGYMIGSFFLAFWLLFTGIGWLQYKQYWVSSRNQKRMDAVIDSMPGYLVWANSAKKLLRVNQRFAEQLGKNASDFSGGSVAEAPDFLSNYFHSLFSNDEKVLTRMVDFNKRKVFLSGQKYNKGTEAIVLGIDMTDQYLVQEQLEFQRSQSHNSARYACLGEVFASAARDLEYDSGTLKSMWQTARKVVDRKEQKEETNFQDVAQSLKDFFNEKAKSNQVEFEISIKGDQMIKGLKEQDVLLVLLNLVQNAFDAIKDQPQKQIKVEIEVTEKGAQCLVKDTGVGIEDFLEDIIFEPNYTTREASESTGLGLSLTKQIVEANKGRITIESKGKPTCFRVEFSN